MCKLAKVKSVSCEQITTKEKAKFALDVHLRKLDLRVRELECKVEKCHEEVKQRLKQNSKQTALLSMKQKKQYEK